MLSEQEAIDKATSANGGFLGTWIETELKKEHWHVRAWSKSVRPGCYVILDALTGKILHETTDIDDPEQKVKLDRFLESE